VDQFLALVTGFVPPKAGLADFPITILDGRGVPVVFIAVAACGVVVVEAWLADLSSAIFDAEGVEDGVATVFTPVDLFTREGETRHPLTELVGVEVGLVP
jgi:hypothetical protein